MSNAKLQRTKNYAMFSLSKENRPINVVNLKPAHKRLRDSMKQYGFIPAFPIMVRAVGGRHLIIDGQHRFTIARELGIEVYFVTVEQDVCVSEINQAQATWSTADFATRWANAGLPDYQQALHYAMKFQLPVALAFAILSGTSSTGNIEAAFRDGRYKIKDEVRAVRSFELNDRLVKANKSCKTQQLVICLWYCLHVDHFDAERLAAGAEKRPQMLQSGSNRREAVLAMLENIYNFARRQQVPLKFDVEKAIKARNIIVA